MRLEEGSEADPHLDKHQIGDSVSAVCVSLFEPECATCHLNAGNDSNGNRGLLRGTGGGQTKLGKDKSLPGAPQLLRPIAAHAGLFYGDKVSATDHYNRGTDKHELHG
jgi:hypothetical protein